MTNIPNTPLTRALQREQALLVEIDRLETELRELNAALEETAAERDQALEQIEFRQYGRSPLPNPNGRKSGAARWA